MIHNSIKDDTSGDHYAVGQNSHGGVGVVLAQIQSDGEQVRISLTPEQARHFAKGLILKADECELPSNYT